MGPILWVSFHRKHILGVEMWFYGGSSSRPCRGVDTLTVAQCPNLYFAEHPFELMKWTLRESNMAFKRSVLGEQMKPILAASVRFVLFQVGNINAESRTEGD